MVCHALGRCRICAKKHKLPIFGSEENQHALMERVHLQLIVLNTVCIDCIGKLEQYVKKSASTRTLKNSTSQNEENDYYQPYNETTSTSQHADIETRPTVQFYVDTEKEFTGKIQEPCENERLKPREDSDDVPENIEQRKRKQQISGATEMRSLTVGNNPRKTESNIRAKRKVELHLCCEFCSKKFTHSGDLKRHKRKHTGEKPYECPECHKMFSQLSNLTRHRLVHSGERPFACAECGQSYSRKGRLANHIGRQLCRRKRRLSARFSLTK